MECQHIIKRTYGRLIRFYLFVRHALAAIPRFHIVLLLQPPLVYVSVWMLDWGLDLWPLSALQTPKKQAIGPTHLDERIEQVPPRNVIPQPLVDLEDVL